MPAPAASPAHQASRPLLGPSQCRRASVRDRRVWRASWATVRILDNDVLGEGLRIARVRRVHGRAGRIAEEIFDEREAGRCHAVGLVPSQLLQEREARMVRLLVRPRPVAQLTRTVAI